MILEGGKCMALLGANGVVTTMPCGGEKICVGCDYWTGERNLSCNGLGATSKNGDPAYCTKKDEVTRPSETCSSEDNMFKKWNFLK